MRRNTIIATEKGAGFVYLFDTGFTEGIASLTKIGVTTDIERREQALRAGNPRGRMVLVIRIKGSAKAYEAKLHRTYRERRVEREVFLLTKTEREVIERRATEDGGICERLRP